MSEGLISKIKEKPMKYFIEGTIATTFLANIVTNGREFATNIDKYDSQVRTFSENIGYLTLQIGLPLVCVGASALFGYIATKGAGLWFDKYYYK